MAKVLIDIPDNKLEWIRKKVYPNYIDNAIKNGIALDGLTNGEVIQKIFSNAKFSRFYCTERLQTAGLSRRDADFDLEFWNAKWGE